MKELIKKIAKAKLDIKNSHIKKMGVNTFSNYDYFTPSQIEAVVSTVCNDNGLLTTFNLIRDNLGIYGLLTVYDVESGQSISAQMATEIPAIKAANIAQQLGGCVTYTERYLKMSFFGITDNRLDFETIDNTKKNNLSIESVIDEIKKVNSRAEFEALQSKFASYLNNADVVAACKEVAVKFPKR